ncbi:MAG: DUF4143 domain-containing protein [Opitutae bacterium]|nr:DUF4143 domain-containing protein [Opitutae bacterium]
MVPRAADKMCVKLAETFPVVAITGPRQSGKTTLAQTTFPNKQYVSLEDPDVREVALSDPRGFLSALIDGAIIDEVQRAPKLFSYLQGIIDKDRSNGRFILTGSHQFLLDQQISQSLAGRAGYLKLLPLSYRETRHGTGIKLNSNEMLWNGFFPSTAIHGADPRLWFGAYVQTYLERDVRQLINVRDLSSFQTFLRLCAGRTGSLLDIGALCNEASVDYKTAKRWLSVLEASYVIHLLKPYHSNYRKRLIKTPKLYFLDTGLVSWLLGIKEHSQLEQHPLRGHVFETLVFSEVLKYQYNQAEPSNLFFWRDSHKNEIDFLLDRGLSRLAIEVKSGQTLNASFFAGLDYWKRLDPGRNDETLLIYSGDEVINRYGGHTIANWRNLEIALES